MIERKDWSIRKWKSVIWRNRSILPKNVRKLGTALQEKWNQISNNVLINLIKSIPRRVEACIASKGWPAKY